MENQKLKEKFLTSLSFWRLNFLAWFSFGLLCLVAKVYYYPHLQAGLAILVMNLVLALGLSTFLRGIYRLKFLKDFFELRTLFAIGLCSLGAAFLQAEITQGIVNEMSWGNPAIPPWVALSHRMEFTSLLYVAWSLGYYGLKAKVAAFEEHFRSLKSSAEARSLELQLLRNRIEPHFLFNSLNGIAAEITPHPEAASELLHDVSDYLRHLLDHRKQITTSLSEELETMTSYLRIEQARFGERLQTTLEVTRSAARERIPCFLLQALVENAVKHASWQESDTLEIKIRAVKEKRKLTISVSNTGVLKEGYHNGVGLSTLRRLLELQYPDRHDFTLCNDHGKVLATLILQGSPCFAS